MKKHQLFLWLILLMSLNFLNTANLQGKVLLPSEKKALEKQQKQQQNIQKNFQARPLEMDFPYEKEIDVVQPECLAWVGEGRQGLNKQQLQFYNQCPFSIHANVCVEEYPGKFRLHKSASRIPQFGRLTLYTYEGSPGSVTWLSSRGAPNVPDKCQ